MGVQLHTLEYKWARPMPSPLAASPRRLPVQPAQPRAVSLTLGMISLFCFLYDWEDKDA